MRRVIALGIGTLILASSVLPSLAVGNMAFAAACPGTSSSLPLSVTIPDIGQSGGGDVATPAPTACATTPPPATGGTTPGGSGSGGSGSGGGAATPTTPASPSGEVVAPIPPATPSGSASKLELDPERISVHEWMAATGTGYNADEKVQLVLYPGAEVIGSYVADATGTVTARFRIPDETRSGSHVLEATGWASEKVSNGAFTVVTVAGAGTIPMLWWVIILCGSLLVGLIIFAIYFRRNIAHAFRGGPETVKGTP
ncbi:hypothetical protein GCM10007382_15660 [Salinibacterium xinjiangense]|uniref:Ig-like domain (Group 3) n=1 Tax=Salinibacterium xinjiangense TaxID=386302 RepID=A0A2C8YAZ4_9MICO|nr:hypothetical protein [Salinibacterium xinjiangense]GGK96276.1 hypothetical protein GCM10007382_15660 [Salinibacterium xinjiangense]SOE47403.1 hypothetical protein SAMN06296378_0215 [Salinibacterium xinjiangense]